MFKYRKTLSWVMPKAKEKHKKSIQESAARAINRALTPLLSAYSSIKKVSCKVKEKVPLLYRELEAAVRPNIIFPEKHKEGNVRVGDAIASGIIRNLPGIGEDKLGQIISDKHSKTFVEALAKALGAPGYSRKDYTDIGKQRLFKKILVANRGEIALRIIRACRELGVSVEVIYAKEEKDSLSVKFADKAHCIGSNSSYLDIKKIVDIAKKAKADAIHPGYGFLSENAEFAKRCEKKGIVFIGPSSKNISMLGDKVKARKKMQNYNIPVLPGTSVLSGKGHALKEAEKIGYPIILKAVAGGGGKGMRIVRSSEELESLFGQAESEAQNAFGKKTLYIEKYLEGVKHIEFQVLADKYGNAIHLGERDCTIQRKHQKLIEEAPSRSLTYEVREKMGSLAVKAVSALKYRGAGTVEFLLDKDLKMYFIEVNTRIQVEHGITEIVTGVDLLKEQIKLASGAKLALRQENIKMEGYAIECRINAEDPSNCFMPSPGTVSNYLAPGGPGIRISSVCHTGYKVLPHFDSLLALLICHGKNRKEALARMKRALDEYIIEGVKTTIPFHKAMLNNKDFIRGTTTTSFIEDCKILDQLKKDTENKPELKTPEKVLIVTTAISEYLRRRHKPFSSESDPWIAASRQETANNDENSNF